MPHQKLNIATRVPVLSRDVIKDEVTHLESVMPKLVTEAKIPSEYWERRLDELLEQENATLEERDRLSRLMRWFYQEAERSSRALKFSARDPFPNSTSHS
jgi:hypothetical protein